MHHDAQIEAFYTSRAWRKSRASFLEEKGGLCEICLSKGLIEPAVHVHHKVALTPENLNDPAIALDHSNMMALCSDCHSEIHKKKRWRADALGRVIL